MKKGYFTIYSALVLVFAVIIAPDLSKADTTVSLYSDKDAVTYYNIDGLPLNELASWNSEADGSGVAPVSFASDNTVWNIIHSVIADYNWAVSGEGSKVVVGFLNEEVSLTILPGANIDVLVDLLDAGVLFLIGTNYPQLGDLANGSTVAFSLGTHIIPYHDYYNLSLASMTPAFDGNGTIQIRGVIELSGNVVFPDARGSNQYNIEFHGPSVQFIVTNGNVLRSYDLTAQKTAGSLRLAGNSIVSADNQITLDFSGDANFHDMGNTIYAGNSLNIDGSASAYNFTGTMVLAGTEPGIVNGAGAGNNFNIRNNSSNGPIVANLHNIVIRVANTGGEFRFRGSEGNVFHIKGDLIIESQADGRIRFYNNQVRIEGDFVIEEGFSGSIDTFERLGFVGDELQLVHPGIRIQTATLDVSNLIHVDGGILYTTQLVNLETMVSTSSEGIFAISTSTIIEDDDQDTPYIQGNLGYYVQSTEPQQIFFRVGTANELLPLLLSVTQNVGPEVLYYARVMDSPLPDLEIPSDIEVILEDYFYFFNWDDHADIESIAISLPFWIQDTELDADLLRVLKSSASEWLNLGGNFTGFYVETTIPADGGGFFALGQQLISSAKSITSFVFEAFDPQIIGEIDEVEKSITLQVPFDTNIEALVPTIVHTGADISPASGVAQNFNDPVAYTVTAEDETTAVYTATVTFLPSVDPAKLQITDLNNDDGIFAGSPFSLTFQLLNITDDVVNATDDIIVSVSLATGTGTLSGTLEATIEEGASEATITGILYDTAETGVSLSVSAADLEDGTTELFEVIALEYNLVLNVNPAGAGDVTGGGSYEEGASVTVIATTNEGFTFINWTDGSGEEVSTSETYQLVMPGFDLTLDANFSLQAGETLVHYWHFNTLSGTVTSVTSDYSVATPGVITYPGTGAGFMDERTHRAQDPVSNLNLLMDQDPDQGAVLRVRNPANTRELIFQTPSTGFENLIFTFATTRTSNGAAQQEVYYSVDAGAQWELMEATYDVTVLDVDAPFNGWMLKTFVLDGIVAADNNSDLQFRVLFVGEGADNAGGNHRFDNVSLTGNELEGDQAVKLAIVSINSGQPVVANTPFSLQVQAQDEDNIPTEMNQDLTVNLSLATGTGILSGTLEATIEEGSTSVILTGILYDTPENGVSIMASAEGMEDAVSQEFQVLGQDFDLTLIAEPANNGHVEGGGTFTAGETVTVRAFEFWGSILIGWFRNGELQNTDLEYSFVMPSEDITLTAVFDEVDTKYLALFWFFGGEIPNNAPLEAIEPHFSLLDTEASLEFRSALEGYPFDSEHPNWRKASLERRNAPTPINYSPEGNDNLLFDESGMRGIQVKQPFSGDGGENMLVFNISTIEMSDWFYFSFAAKDEGAANNLVVDYSIDETENWISAGLNNTTLALTDNYHRYSLNFTSVTGIFDNPFFKIRIRFEGDDMTADEGNRVTFNNFTLDTHPEASDLQPPVVQNPPGLQKVVEKGAAVTIDLNDVYNHPLSFPMTFTAQSNRPEMVSVVVAESMLTIQGNAPGDAVITLAANDGFLNAVQTQFRVLVYPEAADLAVAGSYSFNEWSADAPEYTYPDNMIFLMAEATDPGIDHPLLFPYYIPHDEYHEEDQDNIGFPYRNTRRTRINGLGSDGISFINTGRPFDLGGALLAFNTSGLSQLYVNWLGGTILQNSRVYGIRLQYRIGHEGHFTDLMNNGEPVEYVVNSDGHVQEMGFVPLPAELLGQNYIQLLWRYYFVEGESGSRPQLRLDNIVAALSVDVDNLAESLVSVFTFNNFLHVDYPLQTSAKLSVFNTLGQEVFASEITGAGIHRLHTGLKQGIYIVKLQGKEYHATQKVFLE